MRYAISKTVAAALFIGLAPLAAWSQTSSGAGAGTGPSEGAPFARPGGGSNPTAIPSTGDAAAAENFQTLDSRRNAIDNKLQDTRPTPNEWRYVHHNGRWWYWAPGNKWMLHNGSAWTTYPALGADTNPITGAAAARARAADVAERTPSSLYGAQHNVRRVAPGPVNQNGYDYRYNLYRDPPPLGVRSRATFNGPYRNQMDLDPLGLTPQVHNQTIEDASVGGQSHLRPLVGARPGGPGSINGSGGTGGQGVGAAGPGN